MAEEIKSRDPGIVAIQELGPGRADGKKTRIKNSLRQTESLQKAFQRRRRRQVPIGPDHRVRGARDLAGTQGTRILYDTTKYRLISDCRETTGKKNYNSSCSMDMPVMSSDSRAHRRSAAYAEFEDRKTGENFFVVSVHLDVGTAAASARRPPSTPCAPPRCAPSTTK